MCCPRCKSILLDVIEDGERHNGVKYVTFRCPKCGTTFDFWCNGEW